MENGSLNRFTSNYFKILTEITFFQKRGLDKESFLNIALIFLRLNNMYHFNYDTNLNDIHRKVTHNMIFLKSYYIQKACLTYKD